MIKKDTGTFMNLMTDFAFKRLFGSPERKPILMRFLNILFASDGLVVRDIVYHDKEILPDDGEGKRIVYDVYCTHKEGGEHFILEMQQVYHPFFEERSVLYAAKAVAGQLRKGNRYRLKPVYSIFIVDFHLPHMDRKSLHDVRLMDVESHELFSDALRLLFVHLNEAKKDWDDCRSDYDKLLYLMKNMHKMDKKSKAYTSGEFEDMFRESEIASMAAEDVVAYSASCLKLEDTIEAVNYAAKESYEKGMEKGMEKGIEKGMEKGRQEERISMARLLLQEGMSPEQIKRITGYSIGMN